MRKSSKGTQYRSVFLRAYDIS